MAHELRIGLHFFILVRKALGTRSGVIFCACKFMLTYINLKLFRVGWRGVDYLKYSVVAAKILLWCWNTCGKIGKKALLSLNVYTKKHQFFWYDQNKLPTVLLCVGVFNEVKLDTTPCLYVKTFLLLLGHVT